MQSIENYVRKKYPDFHKKAVDTATSWAMKHAAEVLIPRLPDALKYCVDATPYIPRGLDKELERIKREGRQLIIVPNHTSHWDGGVVAANVTHYLKQMMGQDEYIAMLFTGLVGSGQQGKFMETIEPIMEEQVKPYGIDALWPILRPQDMVHATEKQKEVHGQSMMKLRRSAKRRQHIIIFAEGTITGGRRESKVKGYLGRRKGMQIPEYETLYSMIQWGNETKKGVSVLPVGIHGAYDVFDPDFLKPGLKAVASIYTKRNLGMVDVRWGISMDGEEIISLAQRRLGSSDSPYLAQETNIVILGAASKLVPYQARGRYKNVFPSRRTA